MRDYCSGCGESFLLENIDDCQCGRSLCYACMALHKQDSGHSSKSDEGRYRVQMNEVFGRDIVKEIDENFTAIPKVKKSTTLAIPQDVKTDIVLDDLPYDTGHFRYTMTRSEYEALIKELNNDFDRVYVYYNRAVKNLIGQKLTAFAKQENVKPKVQSKTYQVSAMYKVANISAIRYWGTVSLLVTLSIFLSGLIIFNVIG